MHDDYATVQLLLENGASVNARATGDFFMPEDWEEKDIKTMDYQGYAYYGEYPLAFAACFENKDIYDLLVGGKWGKRFMLILVYRLADSIWG